MQSEMGRGPPLHTALPGTSPPRRGRQRWLKVAGSGRPARRCRRRSLWLAAAADFGLPPHPCRRQQQHHRLQWSISSSFFSCHHGVLAGTSTGHEAAGTSAEALWAARGHGPRCRRHDLPQAQCSGTRLLAGTSHSKKQPKTRAGRPTPTQAWRCSQTATGQVKPGRRSNTVSGKTSACFCPTARLDLTCCQHSVPLWHAPLGPLVGCMPRP